jgi:hypothetical protein
LSPAEEFSDNASVVSFADLPGTTSSFSCAALVIFERG